MGSHGNPTLKTGKAYGIFFAEITKHLSEIEGLLDQMTSDDSRYRASAVFHTIKGGAGFFGLGSIASISGRLETMLISPGFVWSNHGAEVVELVNDLKRHAQELPAPTQ